MPLYTEVQISQWEHKVPETGETHYVTQNCGVLTIYLQIHGEGRAIFPSFGHPICKALCRQRAV